MRYPASASIASRSSCPSLILPRTSAHILKRAGSRPAQVLTGLGRIGVAHGDVTWAALLDPVGNIPPGRLLECTNDFQHAVALAGTQVDGMPAGVGGQEAQRRGVAFGQVHDVD